MCVSLCKCSATTSTGIRGIDVLVCQPRTNSVPRPFRDEHDKVVLADVFKRVTMQVIDFKY